jgi:FixJ family two-component response regulator
MQPTPTVHVLDDDESFHLAVSRLLRATGYRVLNHTDVGHFLLAHFEGGPGCILMDIHLPGFNGLDLQEALAIRPDTLPIIIISGYGDVPNTVRAMKAGAVDFLTKPVQRKALLNAIDSALVHDAKERLSREQVRHWRACFETLTPRELEVFNRVIAGKMNKEIAGELKAAERTVKAHRAKVMKKMHASSIAELVHIADRLEAAKIGSASFPRRTFGPTIRRRK